MNDAWFYSLNGQQFGPMPLAELRRLMQTGMLGTMVPVWAQGAQATITAGQAVGNQPIGHASDGLQYIVPTGQTSGSALAAGYLGIFGFFFCPLGIGALALGIMGLRDLKQNPQKNGTGRAWTGIVCGVVQIGFSLFLLIRMLLG